MRRTTALFLLITAASLTAALIMSGCGGGGGGSAAQQPATQSDPVLVTVPLNVDFGQPGFSSRQRQTGRAASSTAALAEANGLNQGCGVLSDWFAANAAANQENIPVYAGILSGNTGSGVIGPDALSLAISAQYVAGSFSISVSPALISSGCTGINTATRQGNRYLRQVPAGRNRLIEAYAWPSGTQESNSYWYVAAIESLDAGRVNNVYLNFNTTLAAAAVLEWAGRNETILDNISDEVVSAVKNAVSQRYSDDMAFGTGTPSIESYADFWDPISVSTTTTYVEQILIDAGLLTLPANQAPSASISVDQASGVAPLTVQFTGGCTDADGSCAAYSWDFGDGATSTIQNPSHTYAASGIYTVMLTVTDDSGITASDTTSISVSTNQTPLANIGADASTGTVPLTVNFTGSCTDTDGTCMSFLWDFGDGSPTSSSQNPSHTYTSAGSFTVTLTVTDDKGAAAHGNALIDVDEDLTWAKTFGETGSDIANAVQQTPDGGYIVAGYTTSFGAGGDVWILKLDASGNMVWDKTFGGADIDVANDIQLYTAT